MTYLELCQKFRRTSGISGSGPSAVTGQTGIYELITDWIADADQLIQEQWFNWGFMWGTTTFNTVASDRDYTLADLSLSTGSNALNNWDDTSFVVSPTTDSYQRLKKLEYKDYRGIYKLGTVPTGKPTHVVIQPDQSIVLYPTPDAVYSVTADYHKKPTRLEANSDTSPIPSQYHDAIIYRAKLMYAEYEDAPEVYQSAVGDFDRIMQALQAHSLPDMHLERRSDNSDYDLTVKVV